MQWFRHYKDASTDMKFQAIAIETGEPVGNVIATWWMLCEHAIDRKGDVTDFNPCIVAATLRQQLTSVEHVLQAFDRMNLTHQNEADGTRIITNWSKRQYQSDSSTERSRASRERKKSSQARTDFDATLQQRCCNGPDTESDTDSESETESDIVDSAPDGAPLPIDLLAEAVAIWNSEVAGTLPRCEKLTAKRRPKLKRTLAELSNDPEHWRAYVQALLRSPFHTGQNDRGWRATIDWAIQPDSVTKIREAETVRRRSGSNKPTAFQRMVEQTSAELFGDKHGQDLQGAHQLDDVSWDEGRRSERQGRRLLSGN